MPTNVWPFCFDKTRWEFFQISVVFSEYLIFIHNTNKTLFLNPIELLIQFSTSFISWSTGAVWGTAIVEIFLAALKVWGSSWLKVSGNFKTQRPEIRMGTPIIAWPQWWSLEDKSLLGVGFCSKISSIRTFLIIYCKVASTNASRFVARLVYMHTQNDNSLIRSSSWI